MRSFRYILLIMLAALLSCKQSYEIPPTAERSNTLVVEGVMNSSGLTSIALSRSAALADTSIVTPERSAQVSIESADGVVAVLAEDRPGAYEDVTALDATKEYRLHIRTSNGIEYISDYVPVINGPQIDSISWNKKANDVYLFVNTHDLRNSTRYYRWTYHETWEYHSSFISSWEYVDHAIRYRVNNDIHTCYNSLPSTNILIGSSAKLANDIISMSPLTSIVNGSEKLSQLYSIEVTQYALTRDAYEYWEQLRKNTEKLGTIFDPQPSANKTNIHCVTNPSEPVIGYLSAGNIVAIRRYIYNQEVLPWTYATGCVEVLVPNDSFDYYFGGDMYIPTHEGNGQPPSAGMYGSTPYCVDCRLSGTNVRPSFWPR